MGNEKKERKKMRKQLLGWIGIVLCIFTMMAAKGSDAVCAKEKEAVTSFSGDVAMVKKEDRGYVMQVTVANSGEDFTGTVQAVFVGSTANCAYDTEITLPSQGIKQFTVSITDTVADTDHGVCALNFLDEDGTLLQSIELKDVFGNALLEVPVGILSEDPASLAYLEAKGETVKVRSGNYPVKLVELSESTLQEKLDGLFFLVIDQYDVSSLGEENIEAIEDWVREGGWLMVGTGEYAEKTFGEFDKFARIDFLNLGLAVSSVSEPGEENVLSRNADSYDYYYYGYTEDGVDFTEMAVAELENHITRQDFYESMENPALTVYLGKGGVSFYYCALGDEKLQDLSADTVTMMYRELSYDHYSAGSRSDWDYIRQEALTVIDHRNTDLDFSGLKGMIALYVVLVGPVLYLVLRKCKKCEWYWVGAPALGVVFIAGVYVLGLGARVNEAKVYSVTSQRADGGSKDTYLLAYHSGTKPWQIGLAEDYRLAGPDAGTGYYYYGSYNLDTEDYIYTVHKGSEGLSVGIRPEENFDSGYFYAGGSGDDRGTLFCPKLWHVGRGTLGGTVTNNTDCDMSYVGVRLRSYLMVFSDVKAGETIDLAKDYGDRCVFAQEYGTADNLLYDLLDVYSYRTPTDLGYEQEDMAALLIGLGAADKERPAGPEHGVVVGVVRDYDRAATGKCDEISYGCLYSYVEPEGGQDAAD